MLPLQDLIERIVPSARRFNGKLLALDPGETTGYAVFECSSTSRPLVSESGHLFSNPVEKGIDALGELINRTKPNYIVCEDYKIYGWKSASHSWSELHTPQLIGCIRMFAYTLKIPFRKEMAQEPKGFVTDDKLRAWGLYIKGKKHARDAIRHGIFFLLFTYNKIAGDTQIPS